MTRFHLAFLAIALILGYRSWSQRPVHQPDGILVREEPTQVMYPPNQIPIPFEGVTLLPLASYKIKARVISTERYHLDHTSTIAPIDICVGWGLLSSNFTLEHLTFEQTSRFCFFSWQGAPPAKREVIESHVANMHLIPAYGWVKDLLFSFRRGQIVELQGDLVEVHWPNGARWRSSLSRTDTGDGACEVMYVKYVAP